MEIQQHFRDIVEHHLNEKSEQFALWAWGPDFKKITSDIIPEKWNSLHGDIRKFDKTGKPWEDIPLMIEIWRKEEGIEWNF